MFSHYNQQGRCGLCLAAALLLGCMTAHAATITVTSKLDNGAPGTLRDAIASAASGDTIVFQAGLASPITLTDGELYIDKDLTITGPGATALTISGNDSSRVFYIDSGNVAIRGLTIANGYDESGDGGGGIINYGSLTLDQCQVKDCYTTYEGGGIYNAGELTITRSSLTANSADDYAGAVEHTGNSLTIENSTLSGNNSASDGGAISHDGSNMTLVSVTIANNTSGGSGGGVWGDGDEADVGNSIIAYNYADGSGPDWVGYFWSNGYNFIGDDADLGIDGDDTTCITNEDPNLAPLALNGATTLTQALQPGSMALAAGDPGLADSTDQRGVTRRADAVDMGAWQTGGITVPSGTFREGQPITVSGTAADPGTGITFSYSWHVTKDGLDYASATDGPGLGATDNFTFTPDDNGTYVVMLTVTDSDGISIVSPPQTITVRNVPATLQNVAVTPTVDEGGTATLSGTIVDPGVADTFTLHVDWGDGTVEDLGYPAGTTDFTATHVYADDNPSGTAQDTYTVTVTLADDDAPPTAAVDIEGLLANLDADNAPAPGAAIVAWVPSAYAFTDGDTGTNIGDGGDDMYDGGNYLNTDLATNIPYTNGVVTTADGEFGVGSQYFTVKYTEGVFVMAATNVSVDTFEITGNNGADGSGTADAVVLSTTVNGQQYTIYAKRVDDGGDGPDPSINHIIIVPGNGTGITQDFSTNTNDDDHSVTGLSSVTELYYVLVAGGSATHLTDTDILNVANAFLQDVPTGASPDINTLLTNLNIRNLNPAILSVGLAAQVPDPYNFTMDGGATYISDGGGDMYDDGNYISTDLATNILYTNGVVTASDVEFGSGSRYFTAKYPGGFVLAAADIAINTFEINGDNGADGGGSVDGTVLSTTVDDKQYTIFVKRVYAAGDPSINQIIIVPGDGAGITHDFSTDTNNSYQSVTGLSSVTELYYVLVAEDPNVDGGAYLADADVIKVANFVLGRIPQPVIQTCSVVVKNVPPTITTLGAPAGVVTGATVNLAPQISDPGGAGDPFTYAWTITKPDNSTLTFNVAAPSFVADQTGTYTITLTVSDDDLGQTTQSATMGADVAAAITSGPTASPNPGVVNETVQFTVGTSSTNVTVAWDFGDGSTGAGSSAAHTFAAITSYTITVTVTNMLNGTSATKTMTLAVYSGDPNDPDGDGYSNEVETASGSDPLSAASTPYGMAPVGDPMVAAIAGMNIKLDFARITAHDTLSLRGWLEPRDSMSPNGQRVIVNVGGVIKTFVLDAKGIARTRTESLSFRRMRGSKNVRFTVTYRGGSFASSLADEGWVNKDVSDIALPVNLEIYFSGRLFTAVVPQSYFARVNKWGKSHR